MVNPTAKGNPRPPKGWKSLDGTFRCAACQKSQFAALAESWTVHTVLSGGTMAEFLEACKEAWNQATTVLNWAISKQWSLDVRRKPGDTKMPAMPKMELYKLCGSEPNVEQERDLFAHVSSSSRAALLQAAMGKYRQYRFQVIWTGESSLRAESYPQPYPITSQTYKLIRGPNNEMGVRFTLGGRTWEIQIVADSPHHQVKDRRKVVFENLISEAWERRQLVLLQDKAPFSHRSNREGTASNTEAGHKMKFVIKVKIAYWRDKPPKREHSGTLTVRTGEDCFVAAIPTDGSRPLWTLHAEQILRSIARHKRFRQSLSDDRKFEKRKSRRNAARMNEHSATRCDRHHDVITAWMHESTRQVAGLANRQKVAQVIFEKQDTAFPDFPWSTWETILKNKLDVFGIDYIDSKTSGAVAKKTP